MVITAYAPVQNKQILLPKGVQKTSESRSGHLCVVSGDELKEVLGQAWEGLLTAVSDQDKPDHSLAVALRQKASLLDELLLGLETGLQHGSASVRSACFAFWHTPSVQCTLGRHLQGERPSGAGASLAPLAGRVLAPTPSLQLCACVLGAPDRLLGWCVLESCLRLGGMRFVKHGSVTCWKGYRCRTTAEVMCTMFLSVLLKLSAQPMESLCCRGPQVHAAGTAESTGTGHYAAG